MNLTWQPGMSLDEVEKTCILQALRFYRGNKSQTALALGITVKTIDNKLERYTADGKLQHDADDARRIESARQLDRARGVGHQVSNSESYEKIANGSSAGVQPQPAVKVGAEQNVPLPKREEVQTVLPSNVAAGGSGRRR